MKCGRLHYWCGFSVLMLGMTSPVSAATHTAASAARADVATAYNACVDGDTLQIPPGTATWSSVLQISKRITVRGSGTNSTILRPSGSHAVLRIFADNVRVTNIGFDGNHVDTSNQGVVQVGSTSGTDACDNTYRIADFRIDHCRFWNIGDNDLSGGVTGYPAIMASGYVYGVMDHNEFFNCYGECLDLGADGTGDNPANPVSLQRSLAYGGYVNGTIYIENNVWNYTLPLSAGSYGAENAFDGNSGSRWVIRYNTFNVAANTRVQALISNHELCAPSRCDGASQGDVGSLMMEIYGNVVNNMGSGSFGVGQFVHQRSGRALIYSNTITGNDTSSRAIVRLSNFRSYHRLGCGAVSARGYAAVAHEATAGKISEGIVFNKTTLQSALSGTGSETTLTVGSVADFPTYGGSILLGGEQIDYTGISGTTLTGCIRGANNTTKAAHTPGESVNLLVFGRCLEQINNTQVWGNKTVGGVNKNTAELGGDRYRPDYTHYDIQSFAQRPNNWQYRDDGTPYVYVPFPYPHPLVTQGGGGGSTNPVIAITPSSRDYGSVAVGSTNTATFTIQNVGGGTLSGSASVSAPFSIVGNATYSLGSNASTMITVRYVPIATGIHNQTVNFSGGGNGSASVSGSAWAPLPGLSFDATAGSIAPPFTVNADNTISQSVGSEVDDGGRAAYLFNITQAGNYVITVNVLAPSEAANSLFVNMDAEPIDPNMIWDIPVSAAATNRLVTWRGTGPPTPSANPQVWTLATGTHQLIIRGREANVRIGRITISAPPAARPQAPEEFKIIATAP